MILIISKLVTIFIYNNPVDFRCQGCEDGFSKVFIGKDILYCRTIFFSCKFISWECKTCLRLMYNHVAVGMFEAPLIPKRQQDNEWSNRYLQAKLPLYMNGSRY
jgi:hypothetical protein